MKKAAQERKEKIQAEFKNQMLQAAERVICRRGYGATTMDEIAREAEFSKATLYKYFRNKGEILLELILKHVEEIRQRIVEIQQSKIEPEEKLKEMIRSVLEIQSQKENISRMFIQDKSFHDFMHRFFVPSDKEENRIFQQALRSFKSKRNEITQAGCLVIKEGIEKGKFVQTAPEIIIKYIEALVSGLVHTRYWEPKNFSPERETDQIFRFLMEGIARKPLQKGEEK